MSPSSDRTTGSAAVALLASRPSVKASMDEATTCALGKTACVAAQPRWTCRERGWRERLVRGAMLCGEARAGCDARCAHLVGILGPGVVDVEEKDQHLVEAGHGESVQPEGRRLAHGDRRGRCVHHGLTWTQPELDPAVGAIAAPGFTHAKTFHVPAPGSPVPRIGVELVDRFWAAMPAIVPVVSTCTAPPPDGW